MNRIFQIWAHVLTAHPCGKLAALVLSLALVFAALPAAAQNLPAGARGTQVRLSSISIPAARFKNKAAWQFVTASFTVGDRALGEKLCRLSPQVFDALYMVLSNQVYGKSGRGKSISALEDDLRRRINTYLENDFVQSAHLELSGKSPPTAQTSDGCWVLRKNT